MKSRKVCIVTGSRAEYGLLYHLMKEIQEAPGLKLQIIVTGMHLSPEYGFTYKEIENDGFKIDKKIDILNSSDTPTAISNATGLGVVGFGEAFKKLSPDLIIVLGDRYEIFAACIAAMFAKIPIGHIHGGETTEGAFDEAIRHSITKMAWWHFTAAETYRIRVIQLGEHPQRVFLVGGMGVDSIIKTDLLPKKELEEFIKFEFGEKTLLVTFHPVTLESNTSETQFKELLVALEDLKDTRIIFTKSNADPDGRIINKLIDDYIFDHPTQAVAFTSMGRLNYLSAMRFVDAVVGNSSSGLAEAPTFRIGTINIGDRQKGRLMAGSVINCEPTKVSINNAIQNLYSHEFQEKLKKVQNPYGHGMATKNIMSIICNQPLPVEPKKGFYDL
jgi:GDP/UDP-N,N'-diacetylbacillosamine 2-epimerase (hydrolysing)